MQRNRVWYLMDDISRGKFTAFAREKAVVSLLIILLGRYALKQPFMLGGLGVTCTFVQTVPPSSPTFTLPLFKSFPLLRLYNGSFYIYLHICLKLGRVGILAQRWLISI